MLYSNHRDERRLRIAAVAALWDGRNSIQSRLHRVPTDLISIVARMVLYPYRIRGVFNAEYWMQDASGHNFIGDVALDNPLDYIRRDTVCKFSPENEIVSVALAREGYYVLRASGHVHRCSIYLGNDLIHDSYPGTHLCMIDDGAAKIWINGGINMRRLLSNDPPKCLGAPDGLLDNWKVLRVIGEPLARGCAYVSLPTASGSTLIASVRRNTDGLYLDKAKAISADALMCWALHDITIRYILPDGRTINISGL